jgi:Cft2 family RNA processing exonuclease
MYRIGHGDCFLLAFPPAEGDRPVYVLIDCGYKPGSPGHIHTKPAEVVANIREATGGHIDVAVVTHEHQDHVNAITATNFKDFTVGETWVAWT